MGFQWAEVDATLVYTHGYEGDPSECPCYRGPLSRILRIHSRCI